MNLNIKALIKARNSAWTKFKRTDRPSDHDPYKRLRNHVQSTIHNAKSTYYNNKLLAAKNATELWRCFEELGLGSAARDSFTLPSDVDALNHHFTGTSHPPPITDNRPTVRISPDRQFYFSYVTVEDVIEAISSSRSNAKGPDDLPMKFIRDCLPVLTPVLLNIFDTSLQCPVAYKQLSAFVSDNDLLDPLQSGFCKDHSTHTALIKIVDDIRVAIDDRWLFLMVAIDFSRTFDLVNIHLLLDKLKAVGFSDSVCRWIVSFLSNRMQRLISPNGEISEPLVRNCGVPQGTINGPPFFSLFTNDAPAVL